MSLIAAGVCVVIAGGFALALLPTGLAFFGDRTDEECPPHTKKTGSYYIEPNGVMKPSHHQYGVGDVCDDGEKGPFWPDVDSYICLNGTNYFTAEEVTEISAALIGEVLGPIAGASALTMTAAFYCLVQSIVLKLMEAHQANRPLSEVTKEQVLESQPIVNLSKYFPPIVEAVKYLFDQNGEVVVIDV